MKHQIEVGQDNIEVGWAVVLEAEFFILWCTYLCALFDLEPHLPVEGHPHVVLG